MESIVILTIYPLLGFSGYKSKYIIQIWLIQSTRSNPLYYTLYLWDFSVCPKRKYLYIIPFIANKCSCQWKLQFGNNLGTLHSKFLARYITRLFRSVFRQMSFLHSENFRTYHRSSVTKTHILTFLEKYSCISNKSHEGIKVSFAKAWQKENTACSFSRKTKVT